MTYRAPVDEFRFLLDHVAGLGAVTATERFAEATPDVTQAILVGAGRLCDEVIAPLQRAVDVTPARLENGVVRTAPGVIAAYRAIAEGGWIGIAAPPAHGGMGLPMTLATAVNDMMSGACLALQICPLLSQGAVDALEHHASDELKALYLPRLISGDWTGTMNLTEPQAGSDVGALTCRAEPREDGTHAVTGQKIFISWGDHDVAANVCHLVLARLPGAPSGTRGISLFLVPKYLPGKDGAPGVANALRAVRLEHKLGLHGAPTAVMEYDGATGFLVGAPNAGMAAMFTMMNNARLGVGVEGIGVADAAYQHALSFALERRQGETPTGAPTIADHADVRRMLTAMKADVFAARGIALSCAVALDMVAATGDRDWAARAALLTPIAKAFGAETGIRVSEQGVQVHGGMGVIEEAGAAQFCRDVRVTAIYEGTNGIQAMDLVGRKLMDGGEAAERLLQEVQDQAESARRSFPDLAEKVWNAAEAQRDLTEWMVAQSEPDERFAGAVPYLRAFARVLGGHFHLKAAAAEGGAGRRTALARVYIDRLLPEQTGLVAEARAGAGPLFGLSLDELAA